jgi:hypothetical protein
VAAFACLAWAAPAEAGTIGRANLDGSGVEQTFIPKPGSQLPWLPFPHRVAVDGTHVSIGQTTWGRAG